MARDMYIDVLIEVPTADLAHLQDPTSELYESMRIKADQTCREHGAHLRTDRAPDIVVRQAQHPLLRLDITLVATRWAITAPETLLAKR